MAISMGNLAAKLQVDIGANTADLRKGMDDADNLLQRGVTGFGKFAAAAVAAGAAAAGVFTIKAIQAGSAFEETLSKSDTVFKESAKSIENWSKTAATSFGQSQEQALAAASTFGNLFVQIGSTSDEAARMSKQMVELASDFASFHNANPEDVLNAMQAAFRGEYDAVQRYVPVINAAAVEQHALKMGLKGTTKELTVQDKALATQALLLEGAGDAMGDFARTNDALENRIRILKSQISDLTARFGSALIPHVLKAWDATEDFAKSLKQQLEPRFKSLQKAAKAIGGRDLPALGAAIGELFDKAADSTTVKILTAALESLNWIGKQLGPALPAVATGIAAVAGSMAAVTAAGQASRAILDFTDKLKLMPKELKASINDVKKLTQEILNIPSKTVSLAQKGIDEARFAILQVQDAIANLKNKTISIAQSGAEKAQKAITAVKNAVDALKDKTVKVTQKTVQAGGGGVNGEQSGKATAVSFGKGLASGIGAAIGGALAVGAGALAAAASSPVLIGAAIVAAVALVGVLAWNFRDEIGRFFSSIGGYLSTAWSSVSEWFTSTLPGLISNFFASVPGYLSSAWSAAQTWFTSTLPGLIGQALGFAFGMALNVLLVWPLEAAGLIIKGIPLILGAIVGLGALVTKAMWAFLSFMGQQFVNVVTTIGSAIGNLILGIVNWFVELPGRIAEFLTMIVNKAAEIGAAILTKISEIITGIVTWFAGLPDQVMLFIEDVRLRGILAFVDLFNNIVATLSQLPSRALEFFAGLINAGIDRLNSFIGWVRSWPIMQTISNILNSVVNGFKDGFQRANDVSRGKLGELIDTIKGIPRRILDSLGNLGRTLYDSGRDLIQGLIDGTTSLLSKMGKFMVDKLPMAIREPFKLALGISSPSKEFMGYGRNIGQGLILGMDDMLAPVSKKMGQLANFDHSMHVGAAAISGGSTMPFAASASSASSAAVNVASGAIVFNGVNPTASDAELAQMMNEAFAQLAEEIKVR